MEQFLLAALARRAGLHRALAAFPADLTAAAVQAEALAKALRAPDSPAAEPWAAEPWPPMRAEGGA